MSTQTLPRYLLATLVSSAILNIPCANVSAADDSSGPSGNYTMVDGVTNGVSNKYNKTCLDVAYKNAYEEAKGNQTSSDDFSNIKCYKDGKEVYCNEIREDGQTDKAKTDHFIEQLPDGTVCVGLTETKKVYDGSVVSCEDVAYKNAYCSISGTVCDLSDFKCYKDHVETACTFQFSRPLK